MKKVLPLFLFLIQASLAGFFSNPPYTVWQSGEYLLWTADSVLAVNPNEFCLSLIRENKQIGQPKCREFGEWERDSSGKIYGEWLKKNLEPGVSEDYLRTRDPQMAKKIAELEDKLVIFIAREENALRLAIFDETSAAPKKLGSIPYSEDKIKNGEKIVEKFFSHSPSPRLSKEERKRRALEPDPTYQEIPKAFFWGGIGMNYAQARIPLTPDNWYDHTLASRVKRYRATRDSLSLWNFLEDESAELFIYGGATWFGMFGGELFYKYSNHAVKTDNKDTLYEELDHWRYGIHDLGISLHMTHAFSLTSFLSTEPFFLIGFQYSFLTEDISLKKNKKASKAYESRIKLDDYTYKGVVMAIGNRLIFWKHYGISLRTGLSTRSRSVSSDPDPNGVREPTTIGGRTIVGFLSASLEYRWQLK